MKTGSIRALMLAIGVAAVPGMAWAGKTSMTFKIPVDVKGFGPDAKSVVVNCTINGKPGEGSNVQAMQLTNGTGKGTVTTSANWDSADLTVGAPYKCVLHISMDSGYVMCGSSAKVASGNCEVSGTLQ